MDIVGGWMDIVGDGYCQWIKIYYGWTDTVDGAMNG